MSVFYVSFANDGGATRTPAIVRFSFKLFFTSYLRRLSTEANEKRNMVEQACRHRLRPNGNSVKRITEKSKFSDWSSNGTPFWLRPEIAKREMNILL